MIFNKKTEADIVAEDRKLIERNSSAVYKLVSVVNDNEGLASRLRALCERLKYLKPVKTKDAMEEDIIIENRIENLKTEMAHINGETSYKVNKLISDIMLLLVDRKD